MTSERQTHTFSPVFNSESKILILGSFPSVKSREEGFYYGNAQNRFWKVISAVFNSEIPITIQEKKASLLKNKISLWDVIESCEIVGSSDSSIRGVIPNDISLLVSSTNITKIFANGKLAEKLYIKHILPLTQIPVTTLPSTSPANAAFSFERLCDIWRDRIVPNSST